MVLMETEWSIKTCSLVPGPGPSLLHAIMETWFNLFLCGD